MDKAKILRLCNEINDKIVEFWNCEQIEHDDAQHIISLLDLIGFEVSAKPVTNAERIRQMTDEELAALIANENDFCSLCAYKSDTLCFKQPAACTHGFYEWLKREVSEDA